MCILVLQWRVCCIIQVYSGAHGRTMIFTRTKAEANELALSSSLKQDCQVLHGDIQQKQREITLKVGKRIPANNCHSKAVVLLSTGMNEY